MADDPRRETELPLWFRMTIIGVLVVGLFVHVAIDIFNTKYDGKAFSLLIGSVVGTALGVNEFLRGRGGGS
ncbi:MAG: hypothetical protein JWO46_1796 [Nocardioidaceae bacterium]|nr:hypothetical protein [Nocardioidaceae bacterium]